MNNKIKVFVFSSFLVGVLAMPGFGFARNLEAEMAASYLGVKSVGLLPTSPLYFLKETGRAIQSFFTFNPVKKAELKLKVADEKLLEAQAVSEKEPQNETAIKEAVESYERQAKELKNRLEALSISGENPKVQQLIKEVADKEVKHQEVFNTLTVKQETKENLQKVILAPDITPQPNTKSKIKVISPNGGEIIPTGPRNFAIKYDIWNFSSKGFGIGLHLLKDGKYIGMILPPGGTVYLDPQYWNYSWTPGIYFQVPENYPLNKGFDADIRPVRAEAGEGYAVRVILYQDDKEISRDTSDNAFSIVSSSNETPNTKSLLKLISPAVGAYWMAGETYSIRWSATADLIQKYPNVDIVLSGFVKGGCDSFGCGAVPARKNFALNVWDKIKSNLISTANADNDDYKYYIAKNIRLSDGSYSWSLPKNLLDLIKSTNGYYKIYFLRTGTANDIVFPYTNNVFKIVSPVANLNGLLKASGPNIYMWGTHTLSVARDCKTPCPPEVYLVKAANDEVLTELKKYENQNVSIAGETKYYELEGGFWGIVAESISSYCANTQTIKEGPLGGYEFQKLGLDTSAHPEILKYRIHWFTGSWSPWYTPGKNDIDWKTNGDGSKRRVWSYFDDHEHEFVKCGNGDDVGNRAPVIVGVSGPKNLNAKERGKWTIKAYDPDGTYLSFNMKWGYFSGGEERYSREPRTMKVQGDAMETSFEAYYNDAGAYNLEITVTDEKGAIAETTTAVNVGEISDQTSKPDLFIYEVLLSNASPLVGDWVDVTVTTKNNGGGNASPSLTHLVFPNGQNMMTWNVGSLGPGNSVGSTASLRLCTSPGSFRFSVAADLLNAVAESDETNNNIIRVPILCR